MNAVNHSPRITGGNPVDRDVVRAYSIIIASLAVPSQFFVAGKHTQMSAAATTCDSYNLAWENLSFPSDGCLNDRYMELDILAEVLIKLQL